METCLLNYFVLNNELKSTCDFNPAPLIKGDGVYEVLRIIGQKPLFLEEHIERFSQSMRLAGLASDLSVRQINIRIKVLIESNKLKNGNIRFQLSIHPQTGQLFLAWITPSYYPSKDDYKNGVRLSSLKAERENPNAKRDNLPVREQANKLIQQNDIFEVLLINKDGFVTEGSRSNVFFVDGKKITTTPLSAVLPGITRSKIIRLAKENGIVVAEESIKFSEIYSFDAVFISGTSIKILPVNRIDELSFTPTNPVVNKMQQLYEESVVRHLNKFSW